ncbi:DUF2277 domain-containing protein [Marinicellulosiphila megalodicopiae]|uniref:DUF2277 domain-containing protein n=1 Tax=Marinicellulosiphila megalodicopiae TaxID=2724896 RepID=UPI003BB06830
MCRNIKPLFNFEPPATLGEIEASALQYVRKVSGFAKPSEINQAAFDQAVRDITRISQLLLNELQTSAPSKNREIELQKKREINKKRFEK